MKKALNCIKMMIAAIVVAILSTACSEYREHPSYYPTHYHFYFRNQSSHTICITDDLVSWELHTNQIQKKSFIVNYGKRLIFHYTEDMNIDHEDEIVFSGAIKVLFDNKYEVTHTEAIPHSLANESSYESYQVTTIYYTFTDADYDYAVEHGVKLDEPTE